ncbi:hypothetical protein ACSTKR_23365, partial [Vibrio parahaemolyticus]
QWSGILGRLDLPTDASPQGLFAWYTSRAFPTAAVSAAARAVIDGTIAPAISDPAGMDAQQWLASLSGNLAVKRQEIKQAVSQAAYRWA